ncbi:tryptophan--tRNA ligase [Ferruginivarius sediminum]|uniref:Tryptophan--tRNA ligase n=1 Tax=Ferruginivarius sediminum TaxID=2661937 RepID=A0A369TGU4_9PROT|nr:tryptophan--tRNA ligase [Ferruginivarius sediminum]RDD63357.1 tryptophan--tRNA ligase [Ferruginivarius sediminum]
MKRIFSGVQPTGHLHLGNYLGAIRNFVALQHDYDAIYCVVDLHAITVWQDPAQLADHTRQVTAAYLAAGIDPKKCIIFNQSRVSAHSELAWIFNCVARLGWLNRMTQFKEKAGKHREQASAGLYVYPTLMAADILAYKATHVPVGEDQKQHLEFARNVAQKFNFDYHREVFPIPEPLILGAAARVMSLRDGSKKMSKSEPSDMTRINMTDDADTIANKIKRATTDPDTLPGPDVLDDAGDLPDETRRERPACYNLLGIYAALSDMSWREVLQQFEGQGFATFKTTLTELAVEKLAPIGNEMNRLTADPAEIDSILREGADRAAAIAVPVLDEALDAVGFLRN